MRVKFIANDNRLKHTISKISQENNLQLDFFDDHNFFYPNIKYADFKRINFENSNLGKYYDIYLKSLYRDFKFSWKHLAADSQFWYASIKSQFENFFDKTDVVLFSNVPHEQIDIILAEIVEEQGKKWFAPLQATIDPVSFQIFSNEFTQVKNSSYLKFFISKKQYIGARFEKENYDLQKEFQKRTIKPNIGYKILDKYEKIMRFLENKKIDETIYDKKVRGLIALHMQPELTTEPLAGKFANPITFIEKVIMMFPEVHWTIKDHPDPSERFRGKYFNKYLDDGLSKKKFSYMSVNKKIDFDQFKIFATINGTIGIEALSKKIPIICHKSALYSNIQGAININSDEIFNNSKLNKIKIGELKSNLLYKGITDSSYSENPEKLDLKIGWENFFSSIKII